MGVSCGRRIVEMIWEDLTPRSILTRESFENALVVHSALAGSTNAMIHLVAMARPGSRSRSTTSTISRSASP
jgi:dihydroxy-acid dehydratase